MTNNAPYQNEKPYGSWKSPITTDLLGAATIGLSEVLADGDDLYWLESRPKEKGRTAIVKWQDGKVMDALPSPLSARSKVNEYGGGSYCVHAGVIYFVLFDDQRIYKLDTQSDSASPIAITQESEKRFGDLQFDPNRNRIIAVCEDHSDAHLKAKGEPQTYLVAIDPNESNQIQILHQGADFYSSPRLSPDGKKIAWICWNHPNMPWDSTELWLADVSEDGSQQHSSCVVSGKDESLLHPLFSPNNQLYCVSDRSNWWNIYHYDEKSKELNCVIKHKAEFASPSWVFGLSDFTFIDSNTIVGTLSSQGIWKLYQIDISSGTFTFTLIDSSCSDIDYVRVYQQGAVFIGASPNTFDAIYTLENKTISNLYQPSDLTLDSDDISVPDSIFFPVSEENEKGHAFYYPPKNKNYCGPKNSAPPLIVFCHGGPTAATHSRLILKIQFWTSRGFAVADVNYGGSTGFGRRYRNRLTKQWGVVDVEDCVACVNSLVEKGLADKNSLAIRGGSAGGYTVLCALTFHDVFKAGASHYGVGNLETLATDTHKFESRYLDSMIGPYPEQKELYQQRSPINHLDKLRCPVIFFQGLQDKVVPPNQAQAMVDALDEKKIPHAYVTFEEEGHGFRQATNQKRAIEAELYFYSRVFGFELADDIEAVKIQHLNSSMNVK